ncbi:glucoamylase [Motilibacter rhizosphaerae]|uniref:glucan 1,4-alpha-glucosidase n=1 Tax=Motilibacter rhizosphaerae TaxID=598652 RepID=A0A4Q7NB28_9ACTN|nr:glycoside hydrolase family 15 protein [Motilibacter rhizosphaerae]RZS80171.1 glucoamylase [Motilibacter rhizosphaerae]
MTTPASGSAPVTTYERVQSAPPPGADFDAVAQHMYGLMVRNVATDGFVFQAPGTQTWSKPGCIIASPSYPADLSSIDQDYVFHWTRDAALTAFELVAAQQVPGTPSSMLSDYVRFSRACQTAPGAPLHRGAYRIDASARPWSDQSDGPALRILAVLQALPLLDADAATAAEEVVATDTEFLLAHYQEPTTNLWEEVTGQSFFARSVQLRCFRELVATGRSGTPAQEAADWLAAALDAHWDGTRYRSVLGEVPGGYDPNIDIVCAAVYGAVPLTDTRLLATLAELRATWTEGPAAYPVNAADAAQGLGPLFGRYPGDHYDGDVSDPDVVGGHPWALCTANVAELHYRLATAVQASGSLPLDALSTPFFAPLGITAASSPADAYAALRDAGDWMMRALVYHSDHLELSEQFDGTTGYEKSVRDLTWSYAAFLSAARARSGNAVRC